MRRLWMSGLILILASASAWAQPDRDHEPRWFLTIQGAAGLPQDVWIAAQGNDEEGWLGGGSICLGPLAQGFEPGDHATLLTDVIDAGVVGVDGRPVAPGNYVAPGTEIPDRRFEVVEGETFFAIVEFAVSESNIDLFSRGDSGVLMFTFDRILGRVEQNVVAWFPDANGDFQPFLNEGLMSTNLRFR